MTLDPIPPAPRNVRPLAPKSSEFQRSSEEDGIKRKQPKSRNGCLTCKAKRMKCDETKPSCQQCVRRGLTCGGYRKDLKWKAFGQPKGANANVHQRPGRAQQSLAGRVDNTSPLEEQTDEIGGFGGGAIAIPRSASFNPSQEQSLNFPNAPSSSENHDIHNSNVPWHFSPPDDAWLETDVLLSGLTEGTDDHDSASIDDLAFLDHPLAGDNQDHDHFDWRTYGFDTLEDLLNRSVPSPLLSQDDFQISSEPTTTVLQDLGISSSAGIHSLWRPPPRIISVQEDDLLALFSQPQFRTASPDMISLVFNQYTCRILSIDDEEGLNPWRVHVWPLAKDYSALYHALAAMTCFHISRAQPELRTQALGHVHCSMESLAASVDSCTISLDAALAASLALAWAETWDSQNSSTGKHHIDGARALVKQAHSTRNRTALLDFLINDFLYMDVIARLTSSFDDMSLTKPISYFPDAPFDEPQFDSLMGYASTLFPIIGGVADLVGCIRARTAKRNSPAIISRATELKKAIEKWSPSVDLEAIDDPTSTMSDSIQIAEAYRWATLLLLQQAVPELPNMAGSWQLAQKVLVFLATVPISSTTTIIQHFPLMMAGCEAIEDEDRDWVRDRWTTMSRRMITGIVDKCLQVTTEVWKRRDGYAARWGLCPRSGVKRSTQLSSISADANSGRPMAIDAYGLDENVLDHTAPDARPTTARNRRSSKATRSTSPDFPISAAFNRGVDPLTRSGCPDYTVKGNLHWLGVMKDFGWEVMLG